ncbi:uncharacterized protein [Solanum lycopersicum]|uniref:uncharacterized protein n=1 Tax=Solanum lycopersicum TaxID=4081 RepID=UPI003749C7BD
MILDYKIVDRKTVGSQVYKLQLILHDLIAEDMVVNEDFQVVATIKKLPPSSNDFKNYLKHKRKELKLEDLVIRVKIEEDKKNAFVTFQQSLELILLKKVLPKTKRERSPTSRSQNCPRRTSKATVTIVASLVIGLLIVVLQQRTKKKIKTKVKVKKTSSKTRKMQKTSKEAFATYSSAEYNEDLFMGNTVTTSIVVTGKVIFKITSDKVLTLNNVLHVLIIRRNLVSAAQLMKNGFKCVLVSDKVVIALLLANESQTFKAAMSSSMSNYWKEAVNSEIE